MSFSTRNSERQESNDPVPLPPRLNFPLKTRREISEIRYGWSSHEIQSQLPIHILLVTVNDHEFLACYSSMKQVRRSWCDKLGMVDFGQFGDHNVRVALTQCRQGTAAALISIKNAAEILHPKVALFVGICGTMKPTKAKLGDVVISAKLATYEGKKIRPDGTVEYRGSKADVSRNMARLILSAADGWNPPLEDPSSRDIEVHHDAVMLSGSELVNYGPRREELADYFRDALGLEMEGAGLYAAAYDNGLEWAVIKAVSDFADGSKTATEDWQPFASVMAASLVHHMFKYPDVINEWPHYQITNLAPSVVTANTASPHSRPLRQPAESRPRPNTSINEFVQQAGFGDSGQFRFKDRWIKYEAERRFPSVLTESWSWKYDATATDKATGITMKRGGFLEKDKALKYTVKALLEKLQELKCFE